MKLGHWEYSFILHTCRLGDRVGKATNPFTGDPVEFPIDDGLSVAERKDVRAVFACFGVEGPEAGFEGYALYLPASGSVRFRGGDLEQDEPPLTSFSVELVAQNVADEVLRLVLDVARQGNLAFMSSTGERVCLAKESRDLRIKQRWPDAGLILTTNALRSWLENQIGGRKVHVPRRQ